MKRQKRDDSSVTMTTPSSISSVLTPPDKSFSDKKTYKVVRLANQLTALLISDGPNLYHIDNFYNISSDSSTSGGSSSGSSTSGSDSEIDDDPAYESCRTLENVRNDKFAACALSVKVGSFSDPKEIPGLAHFLEHMVFMGSNKYPKENQFDVFIQKHGGSTNAMTSCECTTFYFDCNVRHLFKALDMFSQFFISPLLKKESMVREREAVDSEFNLAKSSDSARLEQMISLFASDENPASKFMWGDSRTLKDQTSEDELYNSLREFHEKYYSANLMTLAILAKLPIETLENCALECFSQVPNRDASKDKYSISKPLFDRERFHSIFFVSSVKDVTKVTLMWEFPPIESLYRGKPDELIGWLLAHEGKGSLLSYLKSKLWALALWGGITNDSVYCNSLYSLFRLEIALSGDGFKHLYDVITATFAFIKLVKRSLPHKRIFEEIKALNDIDFKFQEEQTTTEFVENVVDDMHYYPSKEFLTGPRLYFEYTPDDVTNLLSYIQPETVNIIVRAKEFSSDVKLNKTEKWFQTKYGREKIPEEMVTKWRNIESYPEFTLPSPNTFISSDFRILRNPPEIPDTKYPVKVKMTNAIEIWHRLDTVYKLPIASINMHFLSPIALRSTKSLIMLDLYISLLTYQLMEESYPANLAQLYFSFEVSKRGGVILKVKGFNHKLPLLLDSIISRMKNFSAEFNPKMFDTFKLELKKNYRNILLKRSTLVQELRVSIIEEPHFSTSEKYNQVAEVDGEDFLRFVETFFSASYVQCLVQGNMSRDQAIDVCSNSVKVFNAKPAAKKDLPYVRIRRIPNGQRGVVMKSFNDMDNNSVTVNYYQWGPANMSQYVRLELLVKLMEEKVFNVLRTQEQLGYEVYCTFRNNFGIIGFTITVHSSSSKFSTSYVEERITKFLETFAQSLATRRLDEFLKEREALIKMKSVVYDNLKQEVDYNFHEIITEEYVFNRRWKEIDCLRTVTLNEIQAMLLSIIEVDSQRNRRLTLQVIGQDETKTKEAQERATVDPQDSLTMQLLQGDKKKRDFYVLDLKQFKEDLYLYPKAKISLDKMAPTSRMATHKAGQKKIIPPVPVIAVKTRSSNSPQSTQTLAGTSSLKKLSTRTSTKGLLTVPSAKISANLSKVKKSSSKKVPSAASKSTASNPT